MAENDKNPFHFGMRKHIARQPARSLSVDDVANQSRFLLSKFIHDRMVADGLQGAPEAEHLIEPGTPTGPPLDRITEVANALKVIGDELDGDERIQRLIASVSPDESRQTFHDVAIQLFSGGNFNWGRVVALFYFAYKMVLRAIQQRLDQVPFLRSIVEWTVNFILENVANWIIERGGWESIEEYFGSTTLQVAGVLLAGILISVTVIVIKKVH